MHVDKSIYKNCLPIQAELTLFFGPDHEKDYQSNSSCKDIKFQTMKAELRYAIHLTEHHGAFMTADHSEVHRMMFPDSSIASNFKCKRGKLTYLLNDAIAPEMRNDIVMDLNSGSGAFSLCIDESTDCNRKFLAVIISFVSLKRKKLLVVPIKTVELKDGTAESLKTAVLCVLDDLKLPLRQCVSIMSDGPSVMVGRHNGFHKLMRDHGPHLLDIGSCTLHHISNAVGAACEELGGLVEQFSDNIFSYFNYTSRWTSYKDVQKLLEMSEHRMIRRVETRWIQLLSVVDRLIEQLPCLREFFFSVIPSNRPNDLNNKRVVEIRTALRDASLEVYLHFLKAVLPKLDKFEKIYQGNNVLIHHMYNDVRSLFKQVLILFLQSKYVEDNACHLCTISLSSDEFFLANDRLFLGETATRLLANLGHDEKCEFYKRVKAFYKALASNLQRCLPLKNRTLRALKFLKPDFHGDEEYVLYIARSLKWDSERLDELTSEWRLYTIDSSLKEIRRSFLDDVIGFWMKVTDVSKYPNLSKIALSSLSVPCGNAAVERVFSDLSDVLTKKRNKLSEISVDSCLLVNAYLKQIEEDCVTTSISESMVLSGFNAHANFVNRLREKQKWEELEKEEIAKKRKLNDEIEAEIERQKKRNKIVQKEKEIANKRASIHDSMSATNILLNEYKKKMDLLTLDLQELDKEEEKVSSKKAKAQKRIVDSAISTVLEKVARSSQE